MTSVHHLLSTGFQPQDRVFLADGPYRSTSGIFLKLREDIRWAEIEEPNSLVRPHPVEWLRHLGAGA